MESTTTAYTKTFSIDLERANYHLKLKKRKRKRILVVLIMWSLMFVYMITPLSRVNLKVNGNVYYTKEELVDIGYINENSLWWLFNSNNAKKVLESYDYIESVEIKKSFFGTKMKISEIYPLGVYIDKYLLNNGSLVVKEDYDNHSKINKITNLETTSESDLEYLATKYSRVDISIRDKVNKMSVVRNSEGYRYAKLSFYDEMVGHFIVKVDLVYLDTKFNENKYEKILGEISKNNVKYSEDNPCYVAYHLPSEENFQIVDGFEGE